MKDQALLLIDIQRDYFPGGRFPLPGAEAAGAHAAELLAGVRRAGGGVVHIRHRSLHEGATFFLPDTPGEDIHPVVAPIAGEPVLLKHRPNSFLNTGLEELLRGWGVSTLFVAGMMTNMCVDASVRAAADLGFRCRLVHDACAAANLAFNGVDVPAPQVHAAFVAALGAGYAEVISCAELLKELESDA